MLEFVYKLNMMYVSAVLLHKMEYANTQHRARWCVTQFQFMDNQTLFIASTDIKAAVIVGLHQKDIFDTLI